MKVSAVLLKPLDGNPEGSTVEFDQGDFETLKGMGAVRAAPSASNKMQAAAPENKAAAKPAVKKTDPVA